MSYIAKCRNPKNGVVYVYECTSYWDSEHHVSRSHRKCIGRLDPVSGEVVPTGKSGRRRKDPDATAALTGSSGGSVTVVTPSREAEDRIARMEAETRRLNDELSQLKSQLKRLTTSFGQLETALGKTGEIVAEIRGFL